MTDLNTPPFTGLEVAVIGLACRVPGAANSREFWNNLINGVESIAFFSDDELAQSGTSSAGLQIPAMSGPTAPWKTKSVLTPPFLATPPRKPR